MKLRLIGILAITVFWLLSPSQQLKINAEITNSENETPQLYKVIQKVELSDSLVLNQDALLFGEQVEGKKAIKFNYNGEEIDLSLEKLSPVSNDNYQLEYKNLNADDIVEETLSIDSIITNPKIEISNIEVSKEHKTKFYIEDNEKYVLIGNISYKVSNKEIESPLESDKSEDEKDSNVEDEGELKEKANSEKEGIDSLEDQQATTRKTEESYLDKPTTIDYNEKEEPTSLSKKDSWNKNNARYFKVGTVSLPVYDSRSGDLVKVGELKQDQIYPIAGDGGNWHIIQFNDIKGFVWKNSTVPNSGNSLQNEQKEELNSNIPFTTKQHVVIYDNSNGSLIPFGTISKNVEYKAVADLGNWVKIIFANRVGYVYKEWLQMGFSSSDNFFRVVDTAALPVYQRINGSLVKKGELKRNQVFPRVGVNGNWHKIQFGNSVGYVWSKSTRPAKKADVNNLNTKHKNSEQFFKTKQHVVVYDLHKGKMTPIGALKENVKYPIVSDTGNWIKIIFGDRVAYIYKEWVRLDFKSSDKAFKAINDHIPVYYNNGGTLNKAGHLIKNEVYLREGYKGNWHKIDFGNQSGYVWMDSTEPANKNAIKNLNKNYTNTSLNIVTNNGVIIYDNSEGMTPFARLESDVVYPLASHNKLGNWYRVLVGGRVGYIYHTGVSASKKEIKNYNITLSEAVNIQMKASPQTDLYVQYVHSDYVSIKNGRYYVNADLLNVRSGPGANFKVVDTLNRGEQLSIRGKQGDWYRLYWVNAKPKDVEYYLDPNNFVNDEKLKFQFLDLSKPSNTSAEKLNNYLENKGILRGLGQAFIEASKKYGINDVYLVSHATLETGNGSSTLANGVKYNGVTVYNMFGIGAYDACAIECGAKKAYEEGWTTPYKSVIGGARFIGNGYIDNGLNTLYKMRWNPKSMETTGKFGKQYATDIGWATKQITTMYNLYQQIDSYVLYLDIPQYKK